ncbi:uncharacterized protein MELLADRAFT_110763 [Melampsora larici-populina 98AG31]|uniref:Uncharacterized protein n=1 Tax=Melampsora larici-populina (strain 98AG31 / pathotype 3-4-7) TaxID=747676 RepID=F4S0W2_MELLP|nr:uncharacterized protein MELLADRAFT_110763 [Melampsora larici-populina 98AG31]EGG01741.1 hypothetical protein MELLADRAFT_110763 [Melampsora larici-populina 98AG31]
MPPKPRASRKLPSSNRITRKQATDSRPEDNTDEPAVVALSKKRKNRPVEPDEEEGSEEALEEIDVSGKRSRTRLLELLDNHITKKKARHSKKKTAKKRPRSGVVENKHVTVRSPEVTSDTIPSTKVNYNKFDKHELVEILRDVGIDASGMEKDRLVETCGFYIDLSGSTGDIIVDEPSDTFIPSLDTGDLAETLQVSRASTIAQSVLAFPNPDPRSSLVRPSFNGVVRRLSGGGKERSANSANAMIHLNSTSRQQRPSPSPHEAMMMPNFKQPFSHMALRKALTNPYINAEITRDDSHKNRGFRNKMKEISRECESHIGEHTLLINEIKSSERKKTPHWEKSYDFSEGA